MVAIPHIGRKARLQHARQADGLYLHDQHAFDSIDEPIAMHSEIGPQCMAEMDNHHLKAVGAILADSFPTDTLYYG